MRGDSVQVIFGVKLRQFRDERGYGLKEFAQLAGISTSYLNEIEKGKKYPKADKIVQLANALKISYDDLVSTKLDQDLNPIEAILNSPVVRELPLQLFGISQHDVINLVTRAPHEAGALVRTLVEVARSYDMQVEHFFHAMLRSYQEAHENYFEEIEQSVAAFVAEKGLDVSVPLDEATLRDLLTGEFGVEVDEHTLSDYPELAGFRSVWINGTPGRLLLNPRLRPSQKAFQLGRELGYRVLQLKERGVASSRAEVSSFDQVLNDFRASYFAGALLINESRVVRDIRALFGWQRWNPAGFVDMMDGYGVTPEIFMYRLSQLIPRHFGLKQIHFLRFSNDPGTDRYLLTKQFNMSQVSIPTGIGLHEHFCRRWLSVEILEGLAAAQREGPVPAPVIGVQVSNFLNSESQFLCIALARPLLLKSGTNTSVTLGFRMDDTFMETVGFANDPAIPRRELNETCERCSLSAAACTQRAAPPRIFLEKERLQQRNLVLDRLLDEQATPSRQAQTRAV